MSEEVRNAQNVAEEQESKTVEEMKAEFAEEKQSKISKMIGFVKTHKKAIIVGVGAAVLTAVAASVVKNAKEDEPELIEDQKPEEYESESKPVVEE